MGKTTWSHLELSRALRMPADELERQIRARIPDVSMRPGNVIRQEHIFRLLGLRASNDLALWTSESILARYSRSKHTLDEWRGIFAVNTLEDALHGREAHMEGGTVPTYVDFSVALTKFNTDVEAGNDPDSDEVWAKIPPHYHRIIEVARARK